MPTKKKYRNSAATLEQVVRQFLRAAERCSRDNFGFIQYLPACYVEEIREVYDRQQGRQDGQSRAGGMD